jgi:hypothetical protein
LLSFALPCTSPPAHRKLNDKELSGENMCAKERKKEKVENIHASRQRVSQTTKKGKKKNELKLTLIIIIIVAPFLIVLIFLVAVQRGWFQSRFA